MNVKKMLDQQSISHLNPEWATTSFKEASSKDTSSIATSSSSKNADEKSKSVGEASSRSQQEEFNQMMADYKRDADKDKFVVLPPTPRIKEMLKKDPMAVWKAIYKM